MVENLRSGLYAPDTQALLLPPTVEQLRYIAETPGARYFSTLGAGPEFVAPWIQLLRLHRIRRLREVSTESVRDYFYNRAFEPLMKKIYEGIVCAQDELAIKGTIATLRSDEITDSKGKKVRTLAQVIEYGSDTENDPTNIFKLSELDDINKGFIRSLLYDTLREQQNAVSLRPERTSIFPILIVYDLRRLPLDGHTAKLPDSVEERSKFIQRVFVLDRPIY
jgi:hypothetical protein